VEIYGEFKGDSIWNNEELVVRGRSDTVRESTLKATGIESFKPGGHFTIVWFDDPEDQDTVNTTELLAKTRRAYALARPMADKKNSMRWLTGTFWSDNDLYCHLIEKYQLGKVDPEGGRLICETFAMSPNGKQALFFKPAEDDEGNPLMPSHFSKEKLADTREEMEFSSPGSYDKQYLLNPVTKKGSRFPDEDHVIVASMPYVEHEVSFGMDFAQSKTEGSDRSGVVGTFHTADYMFYVFEAVELKIDAQAQQNAIFERHERFPHARFFCEADNFVKGWIPHFEIRCRQAGVFPMVEWIDSGARAKKDDRIFATEGLFHMKRVAFLPGSSTLWSQLSRMPASRRKDVADAFANIVQYRVPSLGDLKGLGVEQKKVPGWHKLVENASGPPPWNENGATPENPYAGKNGENVPWPAS
jgi:hypothetical protein